ncbi:FecR domain-containing protein [Geomonas sp. Red32]|uniref:FecR domain-containing protein n=1 Tax=Geomonas sp. Red32 TaxID=2912856 RepID=UPI00202CDE5D|nr:FecR domain-containing protein [Geomonas sp. Red32]MCM0083522.1 FecR domain-containing protein [Geomonas sp. Red32]
MIGKLLFIFISILLAASQALAAQAGKVTKASGTVLYRTVKAASYHPLHAGQHIDEGNWVKTGKDGWIELTLADNSRFTIANNSELEIQSYLVSKTKKTGSFGLTQGKLRASVMKIAGQQTDIKVKSGTAVAGVKGTEFLMLCQGPANIFFGNEGVVSVSGPPGSGVALPAGTMTQNTRGEKPTEAVKVEPNTPLAKAKDAFEASTGVLPPAEWEATDNLPNIVARWDISHGHYLADSGKNEAALQVFQIALDLTTLADIRADARLERGSVYGRLMNRPEEALAEFLLVLEEYPKIPQKETALFNVGETLMQMGKKDLAKMRLKQYLDEYPNGRYRSSVETLQKVLDRQ